MHTIFDMKQNLTVTADRGVIQAARQRATKEGTSLNHLFRNWIAIYAQTQPTKENYQRLMSRLGHVVPGTTFNRDEMNER